MVIYCAAASGGGGGGRVLCCCLLAGFLRGNENYTLYVGLLLRDALQRAPSPS